MNFMTFHLLGIIYTSNLQLTNSYFSEGLIETTNQEQYATAGLLWLCLFAGLCVADDPSGHHFQEHLQCDLGRF